MNKITLGCLLLLGATFSAVTLRAQDQFPAPGVIRIATAHTALVLRHEQDGALTQLFYGDLAEVPPDEAQTKNPPPPVYPTYGNGWTFEPAVRITHVDGNTSTDLRFVAVETTAPTKDEPTTTTRVQLRDPAYPLTVTLCFRAFSETDVIETWSSVRHDEPGEVTLHDYASSALTLPPGELFLTSFHGDWADEMNPTEERLTPGIKVVDSKLGVRADQFASPSFLVSLGAPAKEESGAVIAGSLRWSGSFRLAFETDTKEQAGRTRALCGINPFASEYHLPAGQTFDAPAMVWSYSAHGKGPLSRNLHRWARRYALRDGDRVRDVMLNNWEATDMDFDEAKLVSLFGGAKEVGADLFLLDDGWFGNRHPRNKDNAGLGDWQVNARKLPHGLSYLTDEAKKRGLRFGIWLEPEMVNPQSDLFEAHPDWAIQQPKRALDLSRNQLVLDLARPEVEDFVAGVVENTLAQTPGISYVKWDCNRYLTQPGSPYLPKDRQSHLSVDYGRALYQVMADVAAKHPGVELMLCSGGGGRVDYGALRYFHEFWPSDNTDPVRRVAMQRNYSYFFPAMSVSAHVTRWGKRPLKFAVDVAMSARLGLDLDLGKNTPQETQFLKDAIALYKRDVREIVQQGDLYRIQAPAKWSRTSLDYVSPGLDRAVLFTYQMKIEDDGNGMGEPVRLRGLDPARRYLVQEVDLSAGAVSKLAGNGDVIDGKKLMEGGLLSPCHQAQESAVILLTEVR